MVSTTLKRRRTVEQMRGKPPKRVKKVKKQLEYHSSSEEESADDEQEFQPVNLEYSEDEAIPTPKPRKGSKPVPTQPASEKEVSSDVAESSGNEGDSDSDSLSAASTDGAIKKRKRNDPEAFATSISKILGSKLSTSKRADPVLARSKDAATASKELANAKLEARAKHKIKEEKRAALEKGRVKDVLGLETTDTSTQEIVELEKRLKKTAQRGVIKLFNAVRAAQVKGEEAARESKKTGVVGIGKREDKVTEMSKKGFLDFIAGGGKKAEQIEG